MSILHCPVDVIPIKHTTPQKKKKKKQNVGTDGQSM